MCGNSSLVCECIGCMLVHLVHAVLLNHFWPFFFPDSALVSSDALILAITIALAQCVCATIFTSVCTSSIVF